MRTSQDSESRQGPSADDYLPIEDYGVIGDLHTVALIGKNGSIDWYCLPHFDSPSLFAALLDRRKGGRFRICSARPGGRKQLYFPDTNVLITRFLNTDGVGEIQDFMPVDVSVGRHERAHYHQLVRQVVAVRGEVDFELLCEPAFNYGRDKHRVHLRKGGAVFESRSMAVGLVSPVKLSRAGGGVAARFRLKAGQSATFVLRQAEQADDASVLRPPHRWETDLHETILFWKRWISRSQYQGRWREMVNRSALTLKLLTYAPTGAIVAAPTAGLPERIGGQRNWDYRYTWIRDASFTVYALMRIGFTEEAERFMEWLEGRCREIPPDGSLSIMYTVDGRAAPAEKHLDHWEGYRGSRPVRIGNNAAGQLQLDIYGEMMDSIYLHNKYGSPISYDLWTRLRRILGWVCRNWKREDEGIWEVRSGRQHFVYSKLMCWVALDRGLRLAAKRSFPADRARWEKSRDEIYETVMRKGWDPRRKCFVQSFGSSALDASNLLMPLVKFISPTDPRMLSTLDLTLKELVSDSLVHRYAAAKSMFGPEGTFSMCTFWLVECLTRAGRLDEARLTFEKMLGYANHLGLYAEEIGPGGECLGNFPQAFTHLGLISAAYNLNRALGGGS